MLLTASKKKKQALAKLMKKADVINNLQHRQAVATKIVKFVSTDIYSQDLINIVADTETFNPGEQIQFHVHRELKAHILEPGATGKRSKLIKDSVPLPHHRVYVGTELDLNQLRSGRLGTINDYRRKVGETILGKRNELLWQSLNFSIDSTTQDNNYATFAPGAAVATKKAALDDAIEFVHDNNNNGPIAIVGRYSALSWIEDISSGTNLDTFFPEMSKEQIMSTGFISVYRGVPIFRLRSYKDGDNKALIGASDIHVLSEGTVKFGRVLPGLQSFNNINGQTFSWEIDFWEEYGVAIVESEKNYRIEIS